MIYGQVGHIIKIPERLLLVQGTPFDRPRQSSMVRETSLVAISSSWVGTLQRAHHLPRRRS